MSSAATTGNLSLDASKNYISKKSCLSMLWFAKARFHRPLLSRARMVFDDTDCLLTPKELSICRNYSFIWTDVPTAHWSSRCGTTSNHISHSSCVVTGDDALDIRPMKPQEAQLSFAARKLIEIAMPSSLSREWVVEGKRSCIGMLGKIIDDFQLISANDHVQHSHV